MSADNLAIWSSLAKTDPSQTKQFKRAGGFSGTAVKPIWCIKRMTEQFGPCGTGWGVSEPSFQVVPGHNSEVLVYCYLSIWYGDGKTVFGVGGDKVITYIKANEQYNRPERWENDDEAFKKAFTDAMTNAMKLIGMAADIHMGLFDDNKYVSGLRQEFAEDAAAKRDAKPDPKPNNPKAGIDPARQNAVEFKDSFIADVRKCATLDDLRLLKTDSAKAKALQALADRHRDLWDDVQGAIAKHETSILERAGA